VNPEFQRYLWLEMSFHRMVAVPVILLAVFGLAYLLSDSDALWGMASTSYWMVIVLGVLWGARSASEAVVSEVQEGTWDQQRLSSLGPWSMTWGKLAGSTVFTWYAVAPCLLVLAIGAATRVALVDAVGHALLLAAIVFFAQAVGLLASLHLAARGTAVTRRAAMSLHLVGLAAAAPMLFVSMAGFFDGFAGSVDWFAWEVSTRSFACASVGAFTFWAVLGCHRLMRAELQLPNAPWVWIGFVSFCMVYGAGLAWRADGMPGTAPGAGDTALAAALIAAHLVALGLGYGMLFVEGKDPVVLRRLLRELARGEVREALTLAPRWSCVIPLALLTALASAAVPGSGTVLCASTLVFFVRDAGLVVWLNLGPRRHRADAAALFYLILLYGLAPAIIATAFDVVPFGWLVPAAQGSVLLAVLPGALQAAALWLAVRARWRNVWAPAST
jgi:hypothetical protein